MKTWIEELRHYVKGRQLEGEAAGITRRNSKIRTDVYAPSDLIAILYTINALDFDEETKNQWADAINRYQDPDTGQYDTSDHKSAYHATAMAVSSLQLIDRKPKYELRFLESLKEWDSLEDWLLERDWHDNPWNGCGHDVPAVMSIFEILDTVDAGWFERMFDWLDSRQNPETGMWPKDHGPLRIHHLGAAFHFYFVYEHFRRPIRYADEIIDATLQLQLESGSWEERWPNGFIDLDAVYTLNRLSRVAQHRREEAMEAIRRNMDYTLGKLEEPAMKAALLDDTHRTLGTLSNLASQQEMFPGLLQGMPRLKSVLDRRPFI